MKNYSLLLTDPSFYAEANSFEVKVHQKIN